MKKISILMMIDCIYELRETNPAFGIYKPGRFDGLLGADRGADAFRCLFASFELAVASAGTWRKNKKSWSDLKQIELEIRLKIWVKPRQGELHARGYDLNDSVIIIIIISLTSTFFQEQSRVWTAASQQH